MCIQDIRIGRFVTVRQSLITLPSGANIQLVTRNMERIRIDITPANEACVGMIATDAMTAAFTGSVVSGPSGFSCIYSLWENGQLPTFPFFGWGRNANSQVMVREYFLPEEILRFSYDQLREM